MELESIVFDLFLFYSYDLHRQQHFAACAFGLLALDHDNTVSMLLFAPN